MFIGYLYSAPTMANLSASKKHVRVSLRRRLRNYVLRKEVRKLTKDFLSIAKKGDLEAATKLLPGVFSALDRAVKKNILHKNNAARRKSRLNHAVTTKK